MKEKKDTYYRLLLVPLGMYCIMVLIALFWCLAEVLHLTQQVWLNIGVATGLLFLALCFVAPFTGLILGITGAILRRKYIVTDSDSVCVEGKENADKGAIYWRITAVLNFVLSVAAAVLGVYLILVIMSGEL